MITGTINADTFRRALLAVLHAAHRDALRPIRGPHRQPIRNWTPAVARQYIEIDTHLVRAPFSQHL